MSETQAYRILVIDYDPEIGELVRLILGKRKYAIEFAKGGLQGIAIAERDPPDLIILAIMMPEIDGWETYNRLRTIPALSKTPVLFMAAASPEWVYPKAQHIGIAGYAYMGSGPQALLAACEAILKGETYYPILPDRELQIWGLQTQIDKLARFAIRHLSLFIFLASLTLYTATLMPDVLPADSGEFQRVAATAGLAHPPGYPLYTMLGWLFTRLPLGPNPAWRVSFLSAVIAAATVALVFQTARRMTGFIWGGLAAALMLGSATTFWATATQASIRPLTAFFTALCLYALVLYALRFTHHASRNTRRHSNDRYLILFALSLSLGFTHHYASMVFPAIPFVAYLVLADPTLLRQPRRWLKPIAAFLLGLVVLLYLPLRGSPDINLTTPSGFLHYFLGLGFEGDMFALGLLDRLAIFPTLLHFQFNTVLLLAATVGALLLLWRDRKLALLLLGSFILHTIVVLTYRAPQTVEYELPAYVPLALLAAVPFRAISNLQARKRASVQVCKCAILVIVIVAGATNLLTHLPSYVTLAKSHDTREYAETLLRDAPADAVVLANWHWFTPLRYLQEIEGLRPDVTVEYVWPQGRSLAQNVIDRIEEHIPNRPVIVTDYYEQEYGQLPYRFEPFGQAFLVRARPNFDPPHGLTPLDVTLGRQVKLLGYRLESDETEPSRPLVLTLAWSPTTAPAMDVSLFAQLISSDGRLWSATRDASHPAGRLVAGEVVVERFIVYPWLHALPGDYALFVGAYTPTGRLIAQDENDAVQLTAVRLQPATLRPVTAHPIYVRFTTGPTLIGVDYDTGVPGQVRTFLHWAGPGAEADLHLLDWGGAVAAHGRVPALERGQYATVALDCPGFPAQIALLDGDQPRRWNLFFGGATPLPSGIAGARYVPFGDSLVLAGLDGPAKEVEPGDDVSLGLRFLSRRPLERDYIVSAALVGLNPDQTWAWRADDDSVPALGAIPTLKWIQGSAVFDPHQLTIPADAPQLPAEGSLVVYDHFTQAPLPPLDERFRLPPTVPLGNWTIATP